jgi:hypothetical protein
MTNAVSDVLGVEWVQGQTPGRGKHAHRGDIITFESQVRSTIQVPFEDRGVLLETGFAGGDWPGEMVEITPLVRQVVPEAERDGYTDLTPFKLRALKPERTLVEKASLLHHVASNWQPSVRSDERCGRYYYDIYCLLGDQTTRTALADAGIAGIFSAHIREISIRHYKEWIDRPVDGYGASPAFAPEAGSALSAHLAVRYDQASALMIASEQQKWPSFGQVLKRVASCKTLL